MNGLKQHFAALTVCFYLLLHHQDVAAFIKKEFDKKYNPTWYVADNFV
jgi:hypothetical protein